VVIIELNALPDSEEMPSLENHRTNQTILLFTASFIDKG
jgi:hypothetical protein